MPAPSVFGIEVKTPTDLRKTLGTEDFILTSAGNVPPERETALRECVDSIFAELAGLDRSANTAVSAYLRKVHAPLNHLARLGFCILAVLAAGPMVPVKGRRMRDWTRAYYFIVPAGSFFRIGRDLAVTVHCFDPECDEAMALLAEVAAHPKRLVVWADRKALEEELEGCVPWCISCCLEKWESAHTVDRRQRLKGF